jgi:hypothetical protein
MTGLPVDGFTRSLEALDKLEIHYAVAGSTASSLYGVVRFTRDVNLLVRIGFDEIEALYEGLRADFYLDAENAREAINKAAPLM